MSVCCSLSSRARTSFSTALWAGPRQRQAAGGWLWAPSRCPPTRLVLVRPAASAGTVGVQERGAAEGCWAGPGRLLPKGHPLLRELLPPSALRTDGGRSPREGQEPGPRSHRGPGLVEWTGARPVGSGSQCPGSGGLGAGWPHSPAHVSQRPGLGGWLAEGTPGVCSQLQRQQSGGRGEGSGCGPEGRAGGGDGEDGEDGAD